MSNNRVWLHKTITKEAYLNKKQDKYIPSQEFIKSNIGIRRKMYCYCGSKIIRINRGRKMSYICSVRHQNIIYCGLNIRKL
ncbi:hypothetical protein QKC54_gp0779 [Megavirus baoshan]|uniref:Uncharacterized protein n=1 Tax=Megavirus baoshan TaxID=2496520 RepID=A0A8K1T2R3_9VIRU|nr:hypothetical protein QKC54_gp0779 [Megavirus baoshan]UFX99784.1 hypothetical protein Mb0293 [Megavirus baoshan]